MTCKVLIFDYDDTLVDTKGTRIPAIQEYCRVEHGVSVTQEEVLAVWGIPFDQMMRSLGCSGDIDRERYISDYASHHKMKPFAESSEFTSSASKIKVLGIVTSLARPVLEADLASLGWDDGRFSFLYTEDDSSFHKPDPRVFNAVLTELAESGYHRSDVLYVGDRLTDAESAIGAGIAFKAIARSDESRHMFDKHGLEFCTNLNLLL